MEKYTLEQVEKMTDAEVRELAVSFTKAQDEVEALLTKVEKSVDAMAALQKELHGSELPPAGDEPAPAVVESGRAVMSVLAEALEEIKGLLGVVSEQKADMQCAECGAAVSPEDNECPECGAAVADVEKAMPGQVSKAVARVKKKYEAKLAQYDKALGRLSTEFESLKKSVITTDMVKVILSEVKLEG